MQQHTVECTEGHFICGRLELEPDSVLLSHTPSEKSQQIIAPAIEEMTNTKVLFEVGNNLTVVSGQTLHIKDDLPKLGGKWDSDARVWRMPAERTDELIALCDEKEIQAIEAGAEG